MLYVSDVEFTIIIPHIVPAMARLTWRLNKSEIIIQLPY